MRRKFGFSQLIALFLLFLAQVPVAALANSLLETKCGMACCEKPAESCCRSDQSTKIESASNCSCEISSASRMEFPTILGANKVKVIEFDSFDFGISLIEIPHFCIEELVLIELRESGPPGSGYSLLIRGRAPPFVV